jgi:hypothetical protein
MELRLMCCASSWMLSWRREDTTSDGKPAAASHPHTHDNATAHLHNTSLAHTPHRHHPPLHFPRYEYNSNESTDPTKVVFHALGAWRISPGFHDVLWSPAMTLAASQLLQVSSLIINALFRFYFDNHTGRAEVLARSAVLQAGASRGCGGMASGGVTCDV